MARRARWIAPASCWTAFARYGIDTHVAVGGDGSMRIAHVLSQRGLRVVGVPKTIDNDLAGTERHLRL
jgi:6-phosphofructokinase